MASSVYVVDAALKRTQIKVTPGKYLREILDEACKAKKLNPNEYALKNQNGKLVDLSQPFRLSGLSAGAKLQLTQASRSTGVVSIALQTPESEGGLRLSDKFPSNTSIWLVLRKFEEGVAGEQNRRLNLTQRGVPSNSSGAGRLNYEQPSLNVMGRTLESFTDLQKTLAQLGFNSGSVMMRLSFKSTEQPLEEAMKEITEYFQSVNPTAADAAGTTTQDSRGAHAATETKFESLPDASADNTMLDQAGPEPNDEDVEMTPAPPAQSQPVADDVIASSSETQPQPTPPSVEPSNTINGISVYRAPSNSTPAAALAPDDPSVFEPTIQHAKAHQAALERQGKNTRLLSDKELEEQEAQRQARLATVQNVVVRVRYPDQSMIETTVYASETSADLYTKVRDTLTHSTQPFELRYVGAKGHSTLPAEGSQRLVKDLGFRGKVLVTLVWAQEASLQVRQEAALKEEYRSRAQDLKVDLSTQQAEREADEAAGKKAEPEKKAAGGSGKGRGDMEAKMKKFLGFGKK